MSTPLTEIEELACIYSDVHKEWCGIRPRGGCGDWDADRYREEIALLERFIAEDMAVEAEERRVDDAVREGTPLSGPGWAFTPAAR